MSGTSPVHHNFMIQNLIFVKHSIIIILTCTAPEYISYTIQLILTIKLSSCFKIMNFIKITLIIVGIVIFLIKNTGHRPILFGLGRCLQTCQYTWTGPEHHHVAMPPAYIRYDLACKEVSNATKCGTVMSILINNVIWINKHGPHLKLFNGPNYKWLLHRHSG